MLLVSDCQNENRSIAKDDFHPQRNDSASPTIFSAISASLLSSTHEKSESSSSSTESSRHHTYHNETNGGVSSRRISLSTDLGEISFDIHKKDRAHVPFDAVDKLKKWLKNDSLRCKNKTKEIPREYYEIDIEGALTTFETLYNCDWRSLVEDYHQRKILQIINDLRSCYLEDIFFILTQEFPSLRILNYGSSKLTSDCDLAFALGNNQQAQESMVVTRFNQLFESEWHLPSSIVFDANAYTMQYVMTASDPMIEHKRARLHHESSLLMKLRNSQPRHWQQFKAATLKRLRDNALHEKKAAEFERIEKKNHSLNDRLNREILKIALATPENTIVDGSMVKYLEIENDPRFEQVIASEAAKAKAADPNLEIRACNALHEQIKVYHESLEKQRVKLFFTLEALDEIAKSDRPSRFCEFEKAFNTQLESCRLELVKSHDKETNPLMKEKIYKHIEFLKPFHILSDQCSEVLEAFKERRGIEKEEKLVAKERARLEGTKVHLNNILKEFNNVRKLLVEDHCIYELNEMKSIFKVDSTKKLSEEIEQSISLLDIKYEEVRKCSLQLKQKHKYWDKAGCLDAEGDWLLLRIQYSNLRSMCFAKEAHVSEGAFAFVVQNLQRGKRTIRTLNQYVQAFCEISGFFSGHQKEGVSPYHHAIEVSKYGERLMHALKYIQERALALKLQGPEINIDIESFKPFFKKIAGFKRQEKETKELIPEINNVAYECKVIEGGQFLSREVIEKINEHVEDIAGTLEAWLLKLTPNQRNAFYFHPSNESVQGEGGLLKSIQDNYF